MINLSLIFVDLLYTKLKMKIEFYKYQGTGNDFIIVDNRENFFPKDDVILIKNLCDRKFGIGADGLILLEKDPQTNFKMVYYNSDGNTSSMCGNGGRCIVAFAKKIAIIASEATFTATDGLHYATINNDNMVSLQMKNVMDVTIRPDYTFLDTGSPHHVKLVDDLKDFDVKKEGAAIRYSLLYGEQGSNVNFVTQVNETTFAVRTYERGVEDETLSCGTGVTAVAIAMKAIGKTKSNMVHLHTEGGTLEVFFSSSDEKYTNIFLRGAATFVFQGTITI